MEAWTNYNAARLRFGLDAELTPFQLALAKQTNDTNLLEKVGKYMLNLKYEREDGSVRAAGSAFYFRHDQPLAVTAAHVTTRDSTAEQLVAFYNDCKKSDVIVLAADHVADISVLQVDDACPLPALRHAAPQVDDTVYVVGFSASSKLDFTKGLVTSTEAATFTIAAFADSGFSGGAVFNLHMELVGMVLGGAGPARGITNQQVRCVDISKLQGFVAGVMASIAAHR